MKKIVFLTTDTIHHKFLLNFIASQSIDIDTVIIDQSQPEIPFDVAYSYSKEEFVFENTNFFFPQNSLWKTKNVFTINNINGEESLELIKLLAPDFGIVFGTKKISTKIISLFKSGLINIHRGLSTEYRGLDCDIWPIYHSDYKNIGVTIHLATNTLDAGDILYQEKLVLKRDMKIEQLRYYTTVLAANLILNSCQDYLQNRIKTYQQLKLGRFYSYMPSCIKEIIKDKFNNYCSTL